MRKQWKKEQASCCCTGDVCLRQSLNQLYNNNKMAKLVLFSTAWQSLTHRWWLDAWVPPRRASWASLGWPPRRGRAARWTPTSCGCAWRSCAAASAPSRASPTWIEKDAEFIALAPESQPLFSFCGGRFAFWRQRMDDHELWRRPWLVECSFLYSPYNYTTGCIVNELLVQFSG